MLMKDWTIKKFRGHNASFACEIHYKGKCVLMCEQSGRGGCNIYHPFENSPAGILQQFKGEASGWGRANRAPSLLEIEDEWILWTVDGTRLGITAEKFLNMTMDDLL